MTEEQQSFFERLDQLGSGERAALRRAAGVTLPEAGSAALSAFYRCLPAYVGERMADRWFAVACLRCLWDSGRTEGTPLEKLIAELLRSGALSDSTEHRVELILDTRWEQDGYLLTKLTRLVKLTRQKSDRVMIDFAALLEDLIFWNGAAQSVQRKWARAVFGKEIKESEGKE